MMMKLTAIVVVLTMMVAKGSAKLNVRIDYIRHILTVGLFPV